RRRRFVGCVRLRLPPSRFPFPAPEAAAPCDGAALAAAPHLAPFLVPRTLLETALRHIAIHLRAAQVRSGADQINRGLLAALERAEDFVDHAIIDQRL